jgi:hypothetical protein
MPDCEPGRAGCFSSGERRILALIFPASILYVLRSRLVKNDALGRAHSPAIELGLKITPLAGLFRPTRCRCFTAETFRGWGPSRFQSPITLQETSTSPTSPGTPNAKSGVVFCPSNRHRRLICFSLITFLCPTLLHRDLPHDRQYVIVRIPGVRLLR